MTERANPASARLDTKSALQIARTINAEDAKVAGAVKSALPQIARAIDTIADAFRRGGRLIYVGTGTSGRIAALDATECPPTFGTDPKMVQFIIAGGLPALASAVEADEDSREDGERAVASKNLGPKDVVVGIAASGRTPFTIAAIGYARFRGANTIAITCNKNTPLEKAADFAIVTEVGPEVISGSTRMKAGSAQKMVLNMLSSGAMVRLGYVYDNLMVKLRQKNSKLVERASLILERATGLSRPKSQRALEKAGGSLPVALVMTKAKVSRSEAEQALQSARGDVRKAIAAMRRSQP